MVLTKARELAGGKVRRIDSRKWVVSIRMSTKTYSTRKSWTEVSMGTGRRVEIRRLFWGRGPARAKASERPARSRDFSLGIQGGDWRGRGGEGCVAVTGPSEAPSLSLGQGPSLLYHQQPFKHPHLGQQHCFQGNQIQRKYPPAVQEGHGHPRNREGPPACKQDKKAR